MKEIRNKIKYIINETGDRTAVIVPIDVWKTLLEDMEYLKRKEEILKGLTESCREAKLQNECKLPEQCLDDFLDEL